MTLENNRVLPLFSTPIYEEIFEGDNLSLVQEEIKGALETTEFRQPTQNLSLIHI